MAWTRERNLVAEKPSSRRLVVALPCHTLHAIPRRSGACPDRPAHPHRVRGECRSVVRGAWWCLPHASSTLFPLQPCSSVTSPLWEAGQGSYSVWRTLHRTVCLPRLTLAWHRRPASRFAKTTSTAGAWTRWTGRRSSSSAMGRCPRQPLQTVPAACRGYCGAYPSRNPGGLARCLSSAVHRKHRAAEGPGADHGRRAHSMHGAQRRFQLSGLHRAQCAAAQPSSPARRTELHPFLLRQRSLAHRPPSRSLGHKKFAHFSAAALSQDRTHWAAEGRGAFVREAGSTVDHRLQAAEFTEQDAVRSLLREGSIAASWRSLVYASLVRAT